MVFDILERKNWAQVLVCSAQIHFVCFARIQLKLLSFSLVAARAVLPVRHLLSRSNLSISLPNVDNRSSPSGFLTMRLCVPSVRSILGHADWSSVPNVKHKYACTSPSWPQPGSVEWRKRAEDDRLTLLVLVPPMARLLLLLRDG